MALEQIKQISPLAVLMVVLMSATVVYVVLKCVHASKKRELEKQNGSERQVPHIIVTAPSVCEVGPSTPSDRTHTPPIQSELKQNNADSNNNNNNNNSNNNNNNGNIDITIDNTIVRNNTESDNDTDMIVNHIDDEDAHTCNNYQLCVNKEDETTQL